MSWKRPAIILGIVIAVSSGLFAYMWLWSAEQATLQDVQEDLSVTTVSSFLGGSIVYGMSWVVLVAPPAITVIVLVVRWWRRRQY